MRRTIDCSRSAWPDHDPRRVLELRRHGRAIGGSLVHRTAAAPARPPRPPSRSPTRRSARSSSTARARPCTCSRGRGRHADLLRRLRHELAGLRHHGSADRRRRRDGGVTTSRAPTARNAGQGRRVPLYYFAADPAAATPTARDRRAWYVVGADGEPISSTRGATTAVIGGPSPEGPVRRVASRVRRRPRSLRGSPPSPGVHVAPRRRDEVASRYVIGTAQPVGASHARGRGPVADRGVSRSPLAMRPELGVERRRQPQSPHAAVTPGSC